MQENGIRSDQIMQVRGYADQHLRKPEDPFDPSNRRVSLIVQYLDKKPDDSARSGGSGNTEGTKPAPAEETKVGGGK